MPPAIQSRISVSALGSILGAAHNWRGPPPVKARKVAAAESCMKCRRCITLPAVLKLRQREDGPKQVGQPFAGTRETVRDLRLLDPSIARQGATIKALNAERLGPPWN